MVCLDRCSMGDLAEAMQCVECGASIEKTVHAFSQGAIKLHHCVSGYTCRYFMIKALRR